MCSLALSNRPSTSVTSCPTFLAKTIMDCALVKALDTLSLRSLSTLSHPFSACFKASSKFPSFTASSDLAKLSFKSGAFIPISVANLTRFFVESITIKTCSSCAFVAKVLLSVASSKAVLNSFFAKADVASVSFASALAIFASIFFAVSIISSAAAISSSANLRLAVASCAFFSNCLVS